MRSQTGHLNILVFVPRCCGLENGRMKKGNQCLLIKSFHTARATNNGEMSIMKTVMDDVYSWNGVFSFCSHERLL